MAEAGGEPRTEAEIIGKYKQLRGELEALSQKINELDAEAQEHELVLKTLEPLQPDRTCFRMIGSVLVKQNVGLVKPVVEVKATNLQHAIKQMSQQLGVKRKQTLDFQKKYKIRVQGEVQPGEAEPAQKQNQQGVLVAKG